MCSSSFEFFSSFFLLFFAGAVVLFKEIYNKIKTNILLNTAVLDASKFL